MTKSDSNVFTYKFNQTLARGPKTNPIGGSIWPANFESKKNAETLQVQMIFH